MELCIDPHPEVASLATEVARTVTAQIEQDINNNNSTNYSQMSVGKSRQISTSGGIIR